MKHRKIVYISPGSLGLYDQHYQEVLNKSASPNTEIDTIHLSMVEQDKSPFLSPYPFYHSELFRAIVDAEKNGYHAAIIGCSADPGLTEARRMASIPVTAPLEANLHLAAMMGMKRVSILVPGTRDESILYTDLARSYALDHVIASITPVDLHYPNSQDSARMILKEPDRLRNIILECHRSALEGDVLELAKKVIREDGASCIYFGCTLWTGMLETLAETLGVPVLDPGLGALRLAEILADHFSASQVSK